MPSHANLKPIAVSDFSPGLYNNSDWLMPAGASQLMEDCYPQPGGGLRAFFKSTPFSDSGITHAAHERLIGLYPAGGIQNRSGAGIGTDRYMATYHFESGNGNPVLYRLDGTDGATGWTSLVKTVGGTGFAAHAADNSPGKASFRLFELADGTIHIVLVVRYGGTDTGLWRVAYPGQPGTITDLNGGVFGTLDGPITIHEDRLISAQGAQIVWTEPGSETFDSDAFLPIDPNRAGARINSLEGLEPSDLLIMRQGAPSVVLQGDISATPAQQVTTEGISAGGGGFCDFCPTPQGLAFISNDGYLYLTDGRTHTKLSQQLSKFTQSADFTTYGDIVYAGEFLFAPRGRAYHFPTQSWFTQTQLAGSVKSVERYNDEVFGNVADGVNFELARIIPESDQDRVGTFRFTTAPLHSDDGRQVVIRQIDVIVNTYDTNATVAITVNGTTVTRRMRDVGRQTVQFLFNERDEVLDAAFVSTSGDFIAEAPSIESYRIWTRSGHDTL